jgi:tRNA(adenine34) deaminase
MMKPMTDAPDTDIMMMQLALEQAEQALAEDEIPIGAVLVQSGKVICADHNRTRQQNNPLAHAEKLVIDQALVLGYKYMNDLTLYVTLEPCHMCAGMIVWSRIGRLVYAAADPKAGCVGSIYNILKDCHFNHHPEVTDSVLSEESGSLLKGFFQSKRKAADGS